MSCASCLHRSLISKAHDVLKNFSLEYDELEMVRKDGLKCLDGKRIGQEIKFPVDERIKGIFVHLVLGAITEACEQMIIERNNIIDKITLEVYDETKKCGEEVLTAPERQKIAFAKQDIERLKAWSKSPVKLFTDPLEP